MSDRYDVWGWREKQLDEAAREVADAIGVPLQARRGDHLGQYFMWRGEHDDTVRVCVNADDGEGPSIEPDHPEFAVLVQVAKHRDWSFLDAALSRIPGLTPLRSTTFD